MTSEYTIRFSGLKDGKHDFSFQLTDSFFEQLDYSIIEGGNLDAEVELDKSPNMLELLFKIKGSVRVMCDRCTDYFNLDVEGSEGLIYKFSDAPVDDDLSPPAGRCHWIPPRRHRVDEFYECDAHCCDDDL